MKNIFSKITNFNNNKWVMAFYNTVLTGWLSYSFYKLGKEGSTTFWIIMVSSLCLFELFIIIMTAVLYDIKINKNKEKDNKKVKKNINQEKVVQN